MPAAQLDGEQLEAALQAALHLLKRQTPSALLAPIAMNAMPHASGVSPPSRSRSAPIASDPANATANPSVECTAIVAPRAPGGAAAIAAAVSGAESAEIVML